MFLRIKDRNRKKICRKTTSSDCRPLRTNICRRSRAITGFFCERRRGWILFGHLKKNHKVRRNLEIPRVGHPRPPPIVFVLEIFACFVCLGFIVIFLLWRPGHRRLPPPSSPPTSPRRSSWTGCTEQFLKYLIF